MCESAGWDVWWDREILAGQSFDEVIEHELGAAKVVLVLWSEHSITSSWVRAEANDALDRGVLIPALLAPVTLPLAFRRAQAADLTTWQGQPDHAGLENLLVSMEATLGPRRGGAASPAAGTGSRPAPASPVTPPVGPSNMAGTPATTPSPSASSSTPQRSPAATPAGTGTGDGTTSRSSSGDGRAGAPAERPATATAGAAATSSGTGGAGGIVDTLWSTPAKRQRTLIGGAVAGVLLVAVVFFASSGGGAPGEINVEPASLDFAVQSGGTAVEILEIWNDGGEAVEDLRWTVTGSLFSVDNSSCPLTLDPGLHCELTILLDASELSEPEFVSAQLLIDGLDGGIVVELTGDITGTRAFGLQPASIDFGPAINAAAKVVSVTNDGDTPIVVQARLDGTGFSAANDCVGELSPGSRCTVTVTVAASPQRRPQLGALRCARRHGSGAARSPRGAEHVARRPGRLARRPGRLGDGHRHHHRRFGVRRDLRHHRLHACAPGTARALLLRHNHSRAGWRTGKRSMVRVRRPEPLPRVWPWRSAERCVRAVHSGGESESLGEAELGELLPAPVAGRAAQVRNASPSGSRGTS